MTAAALLPLLALLSAAPSKGRPSGEPRFQAGQTELSRGNFDAALRDFDAALSEAQDALTLAHIQLARAQTFGAKQDFVQAEAALGEALEFDPESSLDPARVDPGLVRVLEGLRARLKGELRVTSDTPGVKVRFDGTDMGNAPVRADVAIGRHTLEAATADGHFVAKQHVVVHPKTGAQVDLVLVPVSSGAAAVGTSPVEISGAPVARADRQFIPFGEVRFDLDVSRFFRVDNQNQTVLNNILGNFDPSFGLMLGGGFRSRFFRASASVRFRPEVGFHLRGALSIPLTERLDGYVSAEVLGDFVQAQLEGGLGASLGVEYLKGSWFGLFGELGARHWFYSGDDDVVLEGGVRIWFP